MKFLLFVGFFCLYHQVSSQSPKCDPASPDLAGADVIPRNDYASGDADYAAFLAMTQVVTCHGVIKEWNLYYGGLNASTACHNLRLQVWRPVVGETYQLVGENTWNFEADSGCGDGLEPEEGVYNLTVPLALRIPVQLGDVIGWVDDGFSDEARIVEFDEDLSGSNQYGVVRAQRTSSSGGGGGTAGSCDTTSIGAVCDWAEAGLGGTAVHLVRDYSLQAQLDETNDPLIVNVPIPNPLVLLEHQPAGQFVFTVIGHNRWTGVVTVPPPLTYSLTEGFGKFAIDASSGVISTIDELDFETVETYPLEVTVMDGPHTSIPAELIVDVKDVNEPHAIFGLPVRVDLNAAFTGVGYPLGTAENSDSDTDPHEVWPLKTYFLVASDPTMQHLFEVIDERSDPTLTPLDRVIVGKLRTTQSLSDWLGRDRVELEIYCSDGTFTAGPMVVEVVISNQREPPVLNNVPVTVTLPENTGGNVDVHEVDAEVPNRSGGLTYYIPEQYPLSPDAEHRFTITPNNGKMRTSNPIPDFDYFTCNRYDVEVTVSDRFYPPTDPRNVTVEITWVNQPPVWQKKVYTSTIVEKTALGTLLPGVLLDASDRDVPTRDWIKYVLLDDGTSSTGAHLFQASNVTHQVSVAGEVIVPENQDSRTILMQVLVRDAATEEDTATLEVVVMDINDHPPVFTADPICLNVDYCGEVEETDQGGTVILRVTCIDLDGSKNSALTFVVLEPEAFKFFEVESSTQNLVLKQPISHVEHPNITFTVLASDSGSPTLTATATVFVSVTDNNIHRPQFEQDGFYNAEVRSDAEVGSTVVTIHARDLDLPSTSPVTYFLLRPDDDFAVLTSGDVVAKRGLRTSQLHLLYIYARDQGQPERFSDACVVRMDTYDAGGHLVDIHLQYPLADFQEQQDAFMAELNSHLQPWIIKLLSSRLDGSPSRSIARVYALRDDSAATIDDTEEKKLFVSKNSLLNALRTGIPGTPRDWLRGPAFSEFQPVLVLPAYPVWLVDTVGGIIFLTFLCLAIVAAIIGTCIYIAKKHQWLCFKTRVAPVDYSQPQPPVEEEFALTYKNKMHAEDSGAFIRPGSRKPQQLPYDVTNPQPPRMEQPPAYQSDGLSTW